MAMQVIVGQTIIPADMIEEGSLEFNFEPRIRERASMAGTTRKPSGQFDTREVTFNMYYEYAEDLKDLVGDAYNAPVAPATHGNIVWGQGGCVTLDNIQVVFRDDCETTDDKDTVIPEAQVVINFNTSMSLENDKMVEVRIYGQPSEDGDLRFGTGDLLAVSRFDPTTGTTVPVVEDPIES